MSDDSIYGVDVDYSSTASPSLAATTGRIGASALSSQGAKVVAGYDPNTLLAPFRLDASGNLRTAPSNPSGGSVYVYNGQVPPTTAASQYGQQIMAQQPSPSSVYAPLTLDPIGALNVHEKSKPTFRFVAPAVSGGVAKSMMSIVNGSTSSIVRVQTIIVQTPYVYTTGNTLAGITNTANISIAMIHELRRITGQTAGASGTTIGANACDSADSLPSGIVVMSAATLSGSASTPFYRCDANNTDGQMWYMRGNVNEKTLVLRPGEGASVTSVSTTTSYTFDVEMLITVAAA